MEPERHIEKLLRAYAKKRKDAAGAPPEMHPATRRLLQAEVARRSPPPPAGSWFSRIAGLRRPGFAFALGLAAVTILGVVIIVPSLSKTKNRSESMLAMSRAKQAPVADEAARADRQASAESASVSEEVAKSAAAPAAPAVSSAPAAGDVNIAVKESGSRDERVYNTETAGRPGAFEGPSDKGVAMNSPASSEAKDFDKLSAGGGAGPAALEPGNEAASKLVTAKNETSQSLQAGYSGIAQAASAGLEMPVSNVQHFVQARPVQAEREAAKVLAQLPQNVSNVLNSFKLEQNGQQIRIVDSDGSVYVGSVQWTGETSGESPEIRRGAKLSDAEAAKKAKPEPVQNYLVSWSGQNMSLNQNVTFNGSLQAAGAAPAQKLDGAATVEGKFQALKNNLATVPLANARISGTAVIDNKQQIRVDAVSATPASP